MARQRHGSGRSPQNHSLVIQEAARLLATGEAQDFTSAKRKAAQHLGLNDQRLSLDNLEIEQALQEYQRLFLADRHDAHLRRLRETALKAMRLLAPFQPRLTGPVLSGSAGPHAVIHLHLFADHGEAVALYLMEQHIPFGHAERRVRLTRERSANYPLYRFEAGVDTLELTVFPLMGLRQAPLSPVDGRPMPRADAAAVEQLLEKGAHSSAG